MTGNKSTDHEKAVASLMSALKKGDASVVTDADWISEEDLLAIFSSDDKRRQSGVVQP